MRADGGGAQPSNDRDLIRVLAGRSGSMKQKLDTDPLHQGFCDVSDE